MLETFEVENLLAALEQEIEENRVVYENSKQYTSERRRTIQKHCPHYSGFTTERFFDMHKGLYDCTDTCNVCGKVSHKYYERVDK